MSPTTIDNSPSGPCCTLSGIHSTDSTAGVHGEARHYLRRLFASWIPSWHDEALCRESDDMATWFPTRGQSNQPALDICGRCPVRGECLNEALDDPASDHGVRGGATAAARKTMRKNRNRLKEQTNGKT
jgi:WhiB family redox-sensing transcriptional regulator